MSIVALIDTNVWVSALLNPKGYPAQAIEAWRNGRYRVVTSQGLLDELAEVLSRPRIQRKYGLSIATISDYLALIHERALIVEPQSQLQLCRDPDDDLVLETAMLGEARYLVSRDDDLKSDSELIRQMLFYGCEVISVQRFITLITISSS
ncbi:putative toxin-antitoxin system toxin component, PIN family [Candidatus Viridilinea mediisalina]|uniref:putative toxin-antitoxin system toxin component, PIN family n=1 Tax=Candidatus Viridilinea mediisalina TaxID=2024553 RepID=UPI0013FD8137|nr:putative toxin-antitoxin system toxin component, PIN family [Candidatus Viridilinea mediisalina]